MNAIQNFNIPVIDFKRAHNFYSKLLDYELEIMEFNGVQLGLFKFDRENGGVGGALIFDGKTKPSEDGTIVYLDTGENLQDNLNKIEHENINILVPKTPLGPNMGFFAILLDTEGNKIGLFSKK